MRKSIRKSSTLEYREAQPLIDEVQQLRDTVEIHNEVLQIQRALFYKVDLRSNSFPYISSNVEQLTGFSQTQWQREGFSAMLARCHPDDLPKMLADMEKLSRQENPEGISEYRWKDNFDEWRWCSDQYRMLLDRQGQAVGMIGCIRDITEQKAVLNFRQAWLDSSSPAPFQTNSLADGDEDVLAALVDTGGLELTRIQRRVLGMILVGMTNKQISLRLHRSIRTIEDHRYRIMRKLGAENSVDLVRKVLQIKGLKAA
jgi:PAS domain S-box-containing protein